MKIFYIFTITCMILSSCALPAQKKEALYRAEQFAGSWIVIDGVFEGREYELKNDGDELVVLAVTDTACLRTGSVVFAGNIVDKQMVGLVNFCIGGAQMSQGKMVVSIKDTSTLTALIESNAGVNFPVVELERVIRLSDQRDD